MHLVFYRTSDVFAAEEALQDANIATEIVPTPVQDKAYCGVCVQIQKSEIVNSKLVLKEFEYQEVP